MALLGIDAGITGVKAVVFSAEGKVLSAAYREYALTSPRPGWSEIDSGEIKAAAFSVIAEAARASGADITALAVSSMGEAVVPVDRSGRPLRSIISPLDTRASEIAAEFGKRVGRRRYFDITGLTPHPCYTVNNILWLKSNEPDVFSRVWKFLQIEDYLGYLLTGRAVMDHSIACRTGLFDVRKRAWSQTLLDAAGISSETLSEPVEPLTQVGHVRAKVAAELGLSTKTTVITGGHDQPMCAIGAGAISRGTADLSMGTVECLTNTHSEAVLNDAVFAHNFPVYCHALPGHYTTLAYTFTSGGLLRWYRDNFAAEESARARASGKSVYEILFDEMKDDFTNVLVAPHLAGTGTPYLDPLARGAFVNVSLATDRKELFLACAQGTVLEFVVNYRAMEECGLAPRNDKRNRRRGAVGQVASDEKRRARDVDKPDGRGGGGLRRRGDKGRLRNGCICKRRGGRGGAGAGGEDV